jgi:L-glyceraldehyde 3-phosphate reductase
MINYQPASTRYDQMLYNRSGRSGLKLPALSLGLWHNFGDIDNFEMAEKIILKAFDQGITHFDLANNYVGKCRNKFWENTLAPPETFS